MDFLYGSVIKTIFLVLDNTSSIHTQIKVREALLYHPRITLVFLPTMSPELNLIEVKCGCGFRGLQHGARNAT